MTMLLKNKRNWYWPSIAFSLFIFGMILCQSCKETTYNCKEAEFFVKQAYLNQAKINHTEVTNYISINNIKLCESEDSNRLNILIPQFACRECVVEEIDVVKKNTKVPIDIYVPSGMGYEKYLCDRIVRIKIIDYFPCTETENPTRYYSSIILFNSLSGNVTDLYLDNPDIPEGTIEFISK